MLLKSIKLLNHYRLSSSYFRSNYLYSQPFRDPVREKAELSWYIMQTIKTGKIPMYWLSRKAAAKIRAEQYPPKFVEKPLKTKIKTLLDVAEDYS